MYDIFIKNATIVDGSGAASFTGNVAIKNGMIEKVGAESFEASKTIDASGKILSPGFIDSHGHNDLSISVDSANSFKLKQGVTSEVSGCCGESIFPFSPIVAREFSEIAHVISLDMEKHNCKLTSVASSKEWFHYCNQLNLGTNMLMLVGQGTIRMAVLGLENRPATPEELDEMKNLLIEAMESGAAGLSTGIAYAPGVFTPEDEITALCQIVADYHGVYSTHLRNQGTDLIESINETIRVVKKTGVKTVISHLKSIGKPNWGQLAIVVKMIAEAQSEGLPIVCDVYPYLAGSTTLKITLPPSVLVGGGKSLVHKVEQKQWQDYIRSQIQNPTEKWENAIGNNGFGDILVVGASNSPHAEGKTLQEYADFLNMDPFDAYFDLIIKNMENGDVKTCNFVMCEEDLSHAICSPYSMIGSDGFIIDTTKQAHPRGVGTFPRYIGRYLRDKKIMSLEEGIRKITGFPADFYSLSNKGYIREGYDADITIFDYNTIIDHADFKNAYLPNDGICAVLVNGKISVENGQFTGITHGGVMKNHLTEL